MEKIVNVSDLKVTKKRNKPNIISNIFICWVLPLIYKGNVRDIEESDLIVPTKNFDSNRLGEKFERNWLEEYSDAVQNNRKPSLWKALVRTFWLAYMPGAVLLLINMTARTIQPLLFTQLLSFWSVEASITRLEAAYYAIGMLFLNFISILCQHHNSLFVNRFSLKIKVAVSALIYRKVLRMSQLSLGNVTAGKLVNLLSNDVARFDMAFSFLHYLWLVPLQLAAVLTLLYLSAGFAPFVGFFGVFILVMPVQAILTKYTAIIRRSTAKRTDRRIKLMNELIKGIQVIKMYAWEKPFRSMIQAARLHELKALKKSICVRSVFVAFMLFTERSTLFVTSLTLVLTGSMLTAATIYPIQQFFSIVQMSLTFILPIAIASLSEVFVSLERIQGVLIMEERDDLKLLDDSMVNANPLIFNVKKNHEKNYIVPKKYLPQDNATFKLSLETAPKRQTYITDEFAVELSEINASWTNTSDHMTLKNINLRLRKGKLCAVIGPVGSGKSSLLQVLLKEFPICKGNVGINGKLSYACQESWLFPATVRENILFGLPYEVNKYKEVCRVCSLLPDFRQFPYGDLSLVGERGVSVSGGQRARINLARAVYREADIYLLDDPLSAVDANVGRQLFEGCINGYLQGRTRILVTHQIHFLKAADFIIVLNEGSIENMGTYDELIKSEKDFSLLLASLSESNIEDDDGTGKVKQNLQRGISKVFANSEDASEIEKKQVMEAEERAKGSLKWDVLSNYFKSINSVCVVITALFVLLLTQASVTSADYWLSFWTNQVNVYEQSLPEGVEPDPSLGTQIGALTNAQYLIIYGGIIIAIIIMSQIRNIIFVIMTARASKNLHKIVFKNLISAVMRFFDTNSSGRILNRFSKDMGAMDELLPRSILETLQIYLSSLSILVLNAIALPWTLIPTFVLLFIFVFLVKWYLAASQAVRRLEGTTKSPVFGMINSTISGLPTIRSSNSQNRLLTIFDDAQDINSSAVYTFWGGSTAFGLYSDSLCLIYLGTIITIFLLFDFGDTIPVGSIALAVSQSMVLTIMLQMSARVTADLLGQMTSVERVLEYSKLPSEENMETSSTLSPENWPSKGDIEFENVCMKYGPDSPLVLKNLNFKIEYGWKVGVVGRTGAGKSSLISALFRLSNIEGTIKIDDIDTAGIAKIDLRSKISIIPQEPVLFSASIRYNLDPFNHYSDDEIWRALEQVELKEAVPALDFQVSEGGTNFSVGQRQLVCLARAVLRSNKILVMDEATANVDPQTDSLIQKTIRREFESCTVITIAHRLNTIMDSDRVLVMEQGEVVEFDYPFILLSNPNSRFNFMVNETGENMRKMLFEIAKTKFESQTSH